MQHSSEFVEEQNAAIVRQTSVVKGDCDISWRSSHSDLNIPYVQVKVRPPKAYERAVKYGEK